MGSEGVLCLIPYMVFDSSTVSPLTVKMCSTRDAFATSAAPIASLNPLLGVTMNNDVTPVNGSRNASLLFISACKIVTPGRDLRDATFPDATSLVPARMFSLPEYFVDKALTVAEPIDPLQPRTNTVGFDMVVRWDTSKRQKISSCQFTLSKIF